MTTIGTQIKTIIKPLFPFEAEMFLRRVLSPSGLLKPPNYQVEELRAEFKERNKGLPKSKIVMRPNITFNVSQEAFESFEAFCWIFPSMVTEFDRFLQICQGKTAFLDVGALHGIFSLTFCHLNPEARVLAVEPSVEAVKVLKQNLALNGLDEENVRVVPVAAGESTGFMQAVQKWHHLEAVNPDTNEQSTELVAIETKKIDDICSEFNFAPEVMKMDIEGYECFAIKGAEETLRKYRPIIFLELHHNAIRKLKHDPWEVLEFIAQLDYEFFDLKDNQLSLAAEQLGQVIHDYFICKPRNNS